MEAEVHVAGIEGLGDVDFEIVVGGKPEGVVEPLDVGDLDPGLEEAVAELGLASVVSSGPGGRYGNHWQAEPRA